jgi:hypothetical protein
MSKSVVISQSMFLPWIGMFEQLRLCDIFIYYDDIQFPQGRSFINRVQIKTKDGIKWLTVPIDRKSSGKLINETLISYNEDWRNNHLTIIKQSFAKAKYKEDIFILVDKIYSKKFKTISELNIYSFEVIARFLGFKHLFFSSSEFMITGSSSQRLVDIVLKLNGIKYITGLGALKYIDYDIFEKNSIRLEYMNYNLNSYTQLFSGFTPYVSILELIANEGVGGVKYINSKSIYWKELEHDKSLKT